MIEKSKQNTQSNMENFISAISVLIKNKLPGTYSQFKMAPLTRIKELLYQKTPDNAIEAAVMLCICIDKTNNKITIPFIKRCEYDGVHSGQIALPGGKKESYDNNLITTAIRETQEEIGINPTDIEILGCLTKLYIPPSNYIVTPVVAYSNKTTHYSIDTTEVAELIEINLNSLLEPDNIKEFTFNTTKKTIVAPAFYINNHYIWGATAMIINELLEIIRQNKLL